MRAMTTSAAAGLYTYAEFGACALAFLPVMGVMHTLHRGDPTQRVPGQWMRRFGRTTSRLTPLWRFSVEGPAPRDIDRRGYVVVANHESTADPFLLSSLPWDMRWVAKEELFHLPIVGLLMRFGGDIPLQRGSGDSVRTMLDECRRTLAAGMSVMIFPEGTRSPNGALLPFKNGAFELAVSMKAPILPIAVAGTRECRPKGSQWFGSAKATAQVLEPIETTALGADDVAAVREQTRERIAEALAPLRDRLGLVRQNGLLDSDPRAERASTSPGARS
jgi:1-acyl-sn-glycerol-3-phosphate acyltransferase